MHKKNKHQQYQKPVVTDRDTQTLGYRVSGRLWVEKDGKTYLGWGRITLLERIRENGSISAAARSMGMGYRHAWELVESMNKQSPTPLVMVRTGGRHGGGAQLTKAGEEAIDLFWSLAKDFRDWLGNQKIL